MATIKAFSAIRARMQHPELGVMKARLEPKEDLGASAFTQPREFLNNLIQEDIYRVDVSSIYIYSHEPKGAKASVGVWALSSVSDFSAGRILPHEQTLAEVEDQLLAYRKKVGMEGSPVLLTYAANKEISKLIEKVCDQGDGQAYWYEDVMHMLWRIEDQLMIESFQQAFKKLKRCYIADGHHRAAAAVRLGGEANAWLSSLYLPIEHLQFATFHRLIDPGEIDRGDLLQEIAKGYYMSYIPNNKPYRPDRKGRMGMFFSGIWYQLDPKSANTGFASLADVQALQELILAPGFGILQPGSDERLTYFDDHQGWTLLLSKLAKKESLIAFTLFSISPRELMDYADQGLILPPKSSCILPKAPFGLLIQDLNLEQEPVK